MKTSRIVTCAAAATLAFATAAQADEKLAKEKACTACHAVGKKVVGPAYADVAKKYQGDPQASAKLVQSIQKGSAGQWGQIPMPANKVTDDEAKALAAWVLSTAK